ncbi:MAG: 23S rRNA (uracil(1939)-C(5))-methyltransferase RlmD [Lachnospiraceae bacterium]|nr:23S rRNA (uracil(1939)-C(5))-methyltransferase RlmD [Lachnospiraceae bacterium]
MQKDEIYTITITDQTTEGEGIGHAGSFALFVKDTVIGDTVECRVMKLKKSYGYAKLLRVVSPSKDRIEARCPHARPCGGCQIQEMDYAAALQFKTKKVKEALLRIGGFGNVPIRDCIGMTDPWRYRNKALVPFGRDRDGRVTAGFFAGRTHTIIETDDCLLSPPEFSMIISAVKEHLERFRIPVYDETSHEGLFRHLLIRKGFSTGEILIAAVLNGETLPESERLIASIQAVLQPFSARLAVFAVNVNKTPGNVVLSPDTRVLYGPGTIEDRIGSIRFRISPNSFFQVNPVMTEILYGKALEFARLTGKETVWDLYSGIGSISLFLAKKAGKVYGVEVIPQAIEDANENARLNGITNASFFAGRAEEVLPEWAETNPSEQIDVIVTDPPREGCDRKCLDTMLRLSPERIVYVSCNPATLARDLRILSDGGYRIEEVQPVDMFPWTGHCESCVLLSKIAAAKHHIYVTVTMDELDLTSAEAKATYQEIRDWVQEKYGIHVTNLNIADVKRMHGIIERENYNKPKSENARRPKCPEEKVKAIEEALKHFLMI